MKIWDRQDITSKHHRAFVVGDFALCGDGRVLQLKEKRHASLCWEFVDDFETWVEYERAKAAQK